MDEAYCSHPETFHATQVILLAIIVTTVVVATLTFKAVLSICGECCKNALSCLESDDETAAEKKNGTVEINA